jgi:phosphoglycerate dehydrogenase-like enzyme
MSTLKIFCDAPLTDPAMQLLREGVAPHEIILPQKPAASVLAKSEFDPAFAAVDIAFGQPNLANVQQAEKLRWMQLSSAGYTRYDTPEFRGWAAACGLVVTNSSGVYSEPCAEHVFALMMAHARRLPEALQSRDWSGTPGWMRLRNACSTLRGQCAVILGFGSIASQLAKMLAPFEMRIIAMRRKPRGNEGVEIVTPEGLSEAFAVADHVVNILPENADSVGFINAARIAWMKPGAAFYNIGRGGTVDQEALLDALHSGHLDSAWLDVADPEPLPGDHPLLAAANCHITPHIAGGHHDEAGTLARHFLANFRRFLDGAPLVDRIM